MPKDFLCTKCRTPGEIPESQYDVPDSTFVCPSCHYENIYFPSPMAKISINIVVSDAGEIQYNTEFLLADHANENEEGALIVKIGRDASGGSNPNWPNLKLPVKNRVLSTKHFTICIYQNIGNFRNNAYTICKANDNVYLAIENNKKQRREIQSDEELYLSNGFTIYTFDSKNKKMDDGQTETIIKFIDPERAMLPESGTQADIK